MDSSEPKNSAAEQSASDRRNKKAELVIVNSTKQISREGKKKGKPASLENSPRGLKDAPMSYIKPLDELLTNQHLLLRAARLTKSELAAMEKPGEIAKQTLAQSPYRSVLRRKNVDAELFLDLFMQKHDAIKAAVKGVATKDQPTRRREIGEIYDTEQAKFLQNLSDHCENPVEFSPLDQQLTVSVLSPASTGLIFQSLHVLAFAHFEHFLASLTRAVLSQRDELLGELNETFTWAQIRDQELLHSTKKRLISKTTGNLLRQSMKHWIDWYAAKTKMQISIQLRSECEALYDLRNLFAHELSVKALYTQFANHDLIERVCESLATLAAFMTESAVHASRIEGEDELFYSNLTRWEVQMIDQSRLNVVEQMCLMALEQFPAPSSIEQHRVNSWIVAKRKSGLTSILKQIEGWDVEQLEPVFALAKLVLLDKKVEARTEANRLMSEGFLNQEDWDSWPLFDELRSEDKE